MGTLVAGEGPQDAEVMLIGQNPGREEAGPARPFVGRSGEYLGAVIMKNGIDRRRLYITSVVKQTTPANRKPDESEIRRWLPRLKNIEYIETYHPAAAMRFPVARKRFESDFAGLVDKIAGRH